MLRTHSHRLDDGIDQLIVVSDVHGNLQALLAFDELRKQFGRHYQILFNGDLCGGGVHPTEVVQWVRKVAGPLATRGNHDEDMLTTVTSGVKPPYTEAGAYQRLSPEERQYCGELPHRLVLEWHGKRIVLMHGHLTPDGSAASWHIPPEQQAELFDDGTADLYLMGHTHYPYVLKRGRRQFANSGSMSSIILATDDGTTLEPQSGRAALEPDEDLRPSYLVVTCQQNKLAVQILRCEYDRQLMLRELEEAGHPYLAGHRRWVEQGIVGHPD